MRTLPCSEGTELTAPITLRKQLKVRKASGILSLAKGNQMTTKFHCICWLLVVVFGLMGSTSAQDARWMQESGLNRVNLLNNRYSDDAPGPYLGPSWDDFGDNSKRLLDENNDDLAVMKQLKRLGNRKFQTQGWRRKRALH